MLYDNLEGRDGNRAGESSREEGTFVYLRQINVDVWQKAIQYCRELSSIKKGIETEILQFSSITTMELDKKSVICEK